MAITAKSLFENALDALPDGVLLTDASRRVIYANPAFATHWRIPPELFHSRDEARMLRFVADQLVDPAAFVREVERLHPLVQSSHDELHFKDGRIFSRRSVPFAAEGALHARIWIFTDVTDARNAWIDGLTGLPNRRAYSRDFPLYVEAPADGLFRSVAILDVDNFKKYNDLYGHAAGDAVLHQIGAILQSHLREADDLLFRIGGEEFLMAARSRSALKPLALFEAVRRSIADAATPHSGNPPYDIVTASVGVGTFREASSPIDVFERVDAALYQAKDGGRNMVVDLSF